MTVGAPSKDLPFCRQVRYALSLRDDQGRLVERVNSTLEYGGLLANREQVPWLVARALQSLFGEVDGTSEATGKQRDAAEPV